MVEKKSDKVRRLVSEGNYQKALGIAKGFRLGISQEDNKVMTIAHECYSNSRFYSSIGVNPDKAIADGITVLMAWCGKENKAKKNAHSSECGA